MRSDGKETCVHIGVVIDRIFRNGVSLDCLRDDPNDQPDESED